MLSARALGTYVYLKASGANISAESLSKVFPEGRKVFLKALAELRDFGLIRTSRQLVNGKFVTQSYLTDGSPKMELLLQQTQQNSNLVLSTYSYISKKEYFRERKEESMYDEYEDTPPMYLEPEEQAEYARKMREKKGIQHRAQRDEHVAQRIKDKSQRTPDLWSTDDSAYYFAEKVALMWHVEPWTAVRTRFKAAYGKARKDYGTTGDVELKMMERFFENLEGRNYVTNPEIIWKVFIKDFGSLLTAVERSNVTQEDLDKAEDILKRQWEKY